MHSDEPPIPHAALGDGAGLSQLERVWGGQRMGNRRPFGERIYPSIPFVVDGEVGDASTGDEHRKSDRQPVSRCSGTGPNRVRRRSAQSRVSFDSEPARPHHPTRTRPKRGVEQIFDEAYSATRGSENDRPPDLARRPDPGNNRERLDRQQSFAQ